MLLKVNKKIYNKYTIFEKEQEVIMEYNDVEKEFLDLLNRSDFKHLSRNDVITYASKLIDYDQRSQHRS